MTGSARLLRARDARLGRALAGIPTLDCCALAMPAWGERSPLHGFAEESVRYAR